jgi:hypothetical protein
LQRHGAKPERAPQSNRRITCRKTFRRALQPTPAKLKREQHKERMPFGA